MTVISKGGMNETERPEKRRMNRKGPSHDCRKQARNRPFCEGNAQRSVGDDGQRSTMTLNPPYAIRFGSKTEVASIMEASRGSPTIFLLMRSRFAFER